MFSEVGEFLANEYELHVGMYLTDLREEVSPKTLQRKLTTFRAHGEFVTGIPQLRDYRAPSPPRPIPHPLTEGMDGVRRMAEQARNPQQRALIGLCGFEGLRISEARSVRVGDLDFGRSLLTVKGKGHKIRKIPLFPQAVVYIADSLAEAGAAKREHIITYSDRGARSAIASMGRKAKISRPVSSHDLRATFATAVYNKTKDLRTVQELLGHNSSQTTEVYTGVSLSTMRSAGV